MKKKIFAVIASMAIAASMSTGVFAVAPGGSDGSGTIPSAKVDASKPVELKTEEGVTLSAPAGAFEEGAKVKIETKVDKAPADAAKTATSISNVIAAKLNVAADSGDAKVEVNTKISIDLYVDYFKKGNPNSAVTVTVAHDGKSNYAAYIGSDGKVELFKLTISGSNASFATTHFSDYYFVTISEKAASSVGTSATLEETASTPETTTTEPSATEPDATEPGATEPGTSGDKNAPTGVAIALAPAILSGAFGTVIAVLKKKKD